MIKGMFFSIARVRGIHHLGLAVVDLDEALCGLGAVWEIESNAFKPYACGTMIHPYIDCARRIAARGLDHERIAAIDCETAEGILHRLWEPLDRRHALGAGARLRRPLRTQPRGLDVRPAGRVEDLTLGTVMLHTDPEELLDSIMDQVYPELVEIDMIDFAELVVLNKFEDMNYAEIAEVMGLTTKAVKSLLSRARARLRDARSRTCWPSFPFRS